MSNAREEEKNKLTLDQCVVGVCRVVDRSAALTGV